jgi:hypothetical protein
MPTMTITVPIRARCVGCKFYQSPPDYWLIGICTNTQAIVKRKDPRYGMDKRCSKWQPKEGEK